MKIHCKSYSKYLVVENIVGGFGAKLKVRLGVESKVKRFSNSFISLLTRKEIWNIAFNRLKGVIKASSLWKRP